MSTPTPCQLAPDLWFSEAQADREYAKAHCRACPLQQQCLELAMRLTPRPMDGIWGGYHARTIRNLAAAAV